VILGRNAGLWVAAIGTILNVLVVVFDVPLTLAGLAALNAAALAVVGLIANAADPTTSATFAPTLAGPSASAGPPSGAGPVG
jgi:hypothetical protein